MAQQRYDLRREADGTWTVFDMFTGRPAVVSGAVQVDEGLQATGLELEEADDLVDLMNLQDIRRRGLQGPSKAPL